MLLQVVLLATVTLGIVRNLILTWRNISIFPESVPWIGRREEWFSRVRVCVRQVFAGLDALKDGYEKVRALMKLWLARCAAHEIHFIVR